MSNTAPTLRQRRKAQTWLAIHEAAAALASERGLDAATIEAVAELAGVSVRTFFNYFRTKEDAVLGIRGARLDPDLLTDLRLDADVIDQLTRLLLHVARSAYHDSDPHRTAELMGRYPHLATRRRESTAEAENLVRAALADLLAHHPDWPGLAGGEAADRTPDDVALMLVLLAGVPLRYAVSTAHHLPATGLSPADVDAALALYHHLQRTLP